MIYVWGQIPPAADINSSMHPKGKLLDKVTWQKQILIFLHDLGSALKESDVTL